MSICDLPDLIAALPPDARAAAERIFAVSEVTGTLVPPAEMFPWIERLFGSVEAVRAQRIVRVTDLVTLEGALFNELRANRPMEITGAAEIAETIQRSEGDPFCHPETGTPADEFGRIAGAFGITAANVAKYDGQHGVLVFNAHDPLVAIDAAAIGDHFATARRWAEAAFARDPEAPYWFLMWNCLWRAGGSIVHGHMQMTTTRGMHYPKIERLRRAALSYAATHGRDYFDDLWLVHDALGLGVVVGGARVFASLTPVKEREVMVVGAAGAHEQALGPAVAVALAALRDMGVMAHDLALYLPPLSPDGVDWGSFPPIARLVDRGDAGNRTSDIGSMELYAASVIAADPYVVARGLRTAAER
ncbi:MAG TPA: hypothetical protein VF998_00545 [Candidatus Limnocylindria bacterium]